MTVEVINNLKKLVGVYFFKSPYHKKETFLPFVINAFSTWNKDFPFEVKTVEYKGWNREDINTGYTVKSIEEFIASRLIIPAKDVPVSKVPRGYKHLVKMYASVDI